MKVAHWTLPTLALALGVTSLVGTEGARAFSLNGTILDVPQRDFRVFNNFQDSTANDNQTPHPNYPGHQGAVMAIWKASVEWGCTLHGDGSGDPHQPFDLGSGGANYDVTFQGEASGVGGVNDNIHSAISGSSGGVLAFTEGGSSGWRIRYYEAWLWDDGPDASIAPGAFDLQGIATRQYGFALGLGHSAASGATMAAVGSDSVALRSIEVDDQAGIQAIYGVCSAAKPLITSVDVLPTQVRVHGQNFSPLGNEVWFTGGGDGTPLKVTGLPSNGVLLTVPIPPGASSGDVLVRNTATGGAGLSTPYPIDLGTPCAAPQSYCLTSPNSVGAGALIGSQGSTSLFAADFELTVSGAPGNQPGIFFYGPDQVNLPFGEGRRCVGGSVQRLPLLFTNAGGSATLALDFGAPPVSSGPAQIVPGGTWNFQFWYRDPPGGPAGFNTTDGLNARFCP